LHDVATVPAWVRELAQNAPYGADNARGSLNLIDETACARAAAAIRLGQSISIARRLQANDYNSTPTHPTYRHESEYVDTGDGMGWGLSHLTLDPHGLQNTHIDALNHVAVEGTFYGGRPVDDPHQGSVDVLAGSGVLTRAIYLDMLTVHGTAWARRPVTADDLDEALSAGGVVLQPGDAVLLDMGRDRFETAVGHMLGGPETDQDAGGGLASDGARWMAERRVSVLAWDMLDSREAKASRGTAHVLGWAIGLVLVDNCDFARLRLALGPGSKIAGALVLAPLAVEGANGVNVNPLVLR
jgi:kynurenine formamidase